MLCQSCGSTIRKFVKQCPSCGEEVTTVNTSTLARKTGFLDQDPNTPGVERIPSDEKVNILANVNGAGLSAGIGAGISTGVGVNGNGLNGSGRNVDMRINGRMPEAVFSGIPIADNHAVRPSMSALPNDDVIIEGAPTREATPRTEILPSGSGVVCRKCHSTVKSGAHFCSACGTSTDPSFWDKTWSITNKYARQLTTFSEKSIKQIDLPPAVLALLTISAVFLSAAVIQFLVPIGIDAGANSQLIYHLRCIELILVALIAAVASLVVKRR